MKKIKIVAMGSTKGTDLQAVIDAIESGDLKAEIVGVFSNKKDSYILERARKHNLPAEFLDPSGIEKEDYDAGLIEKIDKAGADYILLIGYNKILTKKFVDHFWGKAMNIHPSLLPSFKGWDRNVHEEVIESGCSVSGCTLHLLTTEMDSGPIVGQKCVCVSQRETAESLKEKVQLAEQELIVEILKILEEKKLIVDGNRVLFE